MPNIEIHGTAERAVVIARDIFKVLREALPSLAKEVVVTMCNDLVIDQDDKDQPFLRVCTTEDDEAGNLLQALKTLGLDIEYLKIASFFPKEVPTKTS